MGRSRFKFHEDYYPYFITNSIVGGVSVFDDPPIAEIILDSLHFIQQNFEVIVFGYILMHNHMHMIVQAEELSDQIRKFKSFTARKVLDSLAERNRSILLNRIAQARVTKKKESDYQLWQEGSCPKQIDGEHKMRSFLEYIHYNPVQVGFVERPEYWRYSSVRAYLGTEFNDLVTIFGGE